MPGHVCGKYAWYGIGFAVGLLNGLLAAQGIPYHRVPGEQGDVVHACVCSWTPIFVSSAASATNPPPPPNSLVGCAASTWKQAMGLKKQGKDGSIALARHLLPTASIFLK